MGTRGLLPTATYFCRASDLLLVGLTLTLMLILRVVLDCLLDSNGYVLIMIAPVAGATGAERFCEIMRLLVEALFLMQSSWRLLAERAGVFSVDVLFWGMTLQTFLKGMSELPSSWYEMFVDVKGAERWLLCLVRYLFVFVGPDSCI